MPNVPHRANRSVRPLFNGGITTDAPIDYIEGPMDKNGVDKAKHNDAPETPSRGLSKKANFAVHTVVYEAVYMAAHMPVHHNPTHTAVYEAVHVVMYVVVFRTVDRAMRSAMYEAVDAAVDNDPPHPARADFLADADRIAP